MSDLQAFCLFMGYTRSGHSLVGACLDAHPEAAIAHEGRIFEYGADRQPTGHIRYKRAERLIGDLSGRSRRQASRGRNGTRLVGDSTARVSYAVPGGSQGTYDRLRVIGNKAGQESPVIWGINPNAFDELEQLVGVPVKFLHVYRNPWDNIASMARVHGDRAWRRYFKRARLIRTFKEQNVRPVLDVKFEDLVADPHAVLPAVYNFYDLDAPRDLVEACAAIIDPEPNPSRRFRDWDKGEIRQIATAMPQFDWLRDYPTTPELPVIPPGRPLNLPGQLIR